MRIVIQGKPIAKKRPRFARVGKFVRTYNDQETEESRWLWEAMPQIKVKHDGPIEMSVIFFLPIPKSMPKTKIKLIESGNVIPHVKRPDLDNLLKFVKDCLNGVAWQDDAQVFSISAKKIYDINPRTEMVID